jgi:hypothetical protein
MRDKLSKAEIRKDAVQEGVTAASHAVGSVATIITTAVGDIARTLGGFATELFEIRDSARRAGHDQEPDQETDQETDQPTGQEHGEYDATVIDFAGADDEPGSAERH